MGSGHDSVFFLTPNNFGAYPLLHGPPKRLLVPALSKTVASDTHLPFRPGCLTNAPAGPGSEPLSASSLDSAQALKRPRKVAGTTPPVCAAKQEGDGLGALPTTGKLPGGYPDSPSPFFDFDSDLYGEGLGEWEGMLSSPFRSRDPEGSDENKEKEAVAWQQGS